MDDPLQFSTRPSARLVYLCGLSDPLKRDFCRYFRESIDDCDLRVFNLEDGIRTAILQSPVFLFIYTETSGHLQRVAADIAFLRCNLPQVRRVLICNPVLGNDRMLDEVSLDGIILTDARRSDLIACLNNVGRGLRYVQSGLGSSIVALPPLPDSITEKEQEILKYISKGMQNKQIAGLVNSSPHTVKNHKSKMIDKLGLSGTTELYKYAIQHTTDDRLEEVPFDK